MRLFLTGLAVTLALAACRSPAPDAEMPGDAEAVPADAGPAARQDGAASDGVPLRPIMQKLGADMAGFTQALWLEEYDQMAAYADDIVNHPRMSPAEIQRIKSELGQEMDGFVAADEAVHTGALRLEDAAEVRDVDLILQRLNELQVGCMACHTQFRQRLRTDQPVP